MNASSVRNPQTFEERFSSCLHCSKRMAESARGLKNSTRNLRLNAWYFARFYIDMQCSDHNQLLKLIRSGGQTVDDWLNEHLQPLASLGEDHTALLKSVSDGLTLKAFLFETSAAAYAASARSERRSRTADAVAANVSGDPSPALSPEQRCIEFERVLAEVRAALIASERARRDAEALVARLQADLAAVRRQTRIIQRRLDPVGS